MKAGRKSQVHFPIKQGLFVALFVSISIPLVAWLHGPRPSPNTPGARANDAGPAELVLQSGRSRKADECVLTSGTTLNICLGDGYAIPRAVLVELEPTSKGSVYPRIQIDAKCLYDKGWTQLFRAPVTGKLHRRFAFHCYANTAYYVRVSYVGTEPPDQPGPDCVIHRIALCE